MGVFIRLFKVSTKAKILMPLAFMAFANVAFADSESLQKLFKEYNISKDKQEHIKKHAIWLILTSILKISKSKPISLKQHKLIVKCKA